jgi:asparagine synthase (glutamine-hydrolysing)
MTSDALAGGLDMLEIGSGIVFGFDPADPTPAPAATPSEALEHALLPALNETPCGVAFSGGRDSSAVLAAATAVAREHGTADPVPVTASYPAFRSTEETEYQESVIRHLGLREWIRIEPKGRLDILGDTATDLTTRHGLLYPGNIHFLVPVFEAVSGGALLTGIGGDEVLDGHRDHDLAAMLCARTRPTMKLARSLAKRYLAPGRNRRQMRDHIRGFFPWLTPDATDTTIELLIDDQMAGSLFADRYLGATVIRARYLHRAQSDMQTVARDFGVTMVNPLLDATFISAIAHDIGRVGVATRTEMMHRYFDDLLPLEVIERSTKATFDDVLWTKATTADALSLRVERLESIVDTRGLHSLWRSGALKGNTALIAKYLMGLHVQTASPSERAAQDSG